MEKAITKEEYQKMLDIHDWYYHYSDDHEVWKRGSSKEAELLKIAENNGELMKMWQLKWSQMFKNKK